MKLARYWARDRAEVTGRDGASIAAVARGWSDESVDAARARAREIAHRVAERVASNPDERNQYQYGDRPLPEPVIREFGTSAVVTRNAYGALVLNADRLMFIDVDREEAKPRAGEGGGVISGILSLFGKSAPPPAPEVADPVLEGIQRIAERHDFSGRVYKTKAGYRVLITSASFQAGSAETLLKEFGCDPLYMRLCRLQESFRARLTPKPWRCGFYKPFISFPFESAHNEDLFRRWEIEYNSKAAAFATCRLVTTFGKSRALPEFEDLIRYHDVETKASSDFPLA